MKKILQIVDTYNWAIGTLSKAVVKYNSHYDWHQLEIHPKDLEFGKVDLEKIKSEILWADIVEVQYWRVLSQLLEKMPDVLKDKKIILTHHNEKNLLSYEWTPNVIHIAKTKYSEVVLNEKYPNGKVYYIPNSFDPNIFKYNPEYPPREKAVGYVGRIVPWKGLKDIARACYELGYLLMMMGKRDKDTYFNEIPEEQRNNMDMSFFNCPDDERVNFYKNITVYVGNSGGGREVGTLGFIEAMASGVPVVTTSAGLAADIGDHDVNMLMVDYDDYDGLKESIKTLMEAPALQARLRKSAWETIRGYNDERMALQYRDVFNSIIFDGDLVSVIIPTTPDRQIQTMQILDSLKESNYKNIEAVVIFDGCEMVSPNVQWTLKSSYSYPVKVLSTNLKEGYNLGLARNLGAIEADGRYLMFNDSRLLPDINAIDEFLKVISTRKKGDKVWLFGEKGSEKTTFVENFSMIRRQDFINAGMCSERINAYGGMSQELRSRFGRQGFEFGYVPNAKATQLLKSPQTPQKKDGIIKMKNLLFKMNMQ